MLSFKRTYFKVKGSKLPVIKTHKWLVSSLGLVTAAVPVVAVVACGNETDSDKYIDAAVKQLSVIKNSSRNDAEFFAMSITNRPLDGTVISWLGINVAPFNGVQVIVLKRSSDYNVAYQISSMVNHGLSRTVNVEFTSREILLKKIADAKKLFDAKVTMQAVSATVDHPLKTGVVEAKDINAIPGLAFPMPDVSKTGATVTYQAAALQGLTQDITVTISAGTVTPSTVIITLTYSPHFITTSEKLDAAELMFNQAMRRQTLTATANQPIASGVTDVQTINSMITTELPTTLPSGVTASYRAGDIDTSTRIQTITVTLSAGSETRTFSLILTYAP